ncbi:cupredoxin domain-containing protein [Nitrosopumilus sp.]|uniref:cupredoxin domain-containing protein n=1 Tax=Nitrosopumilus sp. TaxID=2024843 RepID=UPI003D0A1F2B
MTKTSLVIFMAAIMVVGTVGMNLIPNAEALKSQGTVSSSTDICGLMLCSEYPGGKTAYEDEWAKMFIPSIYGVTAETKTVEIKQVYVSDHNADKEFPAKLDVFIHKFELDKISSDEALDGIMETHQQYKSARISNDIIDGVGEKLNHYNRGTLNVEEAIESIHLTAEPQNVNPEYQGALDEVIHMFEKDAISADEAIDGIKETHAGFVDLYITSDLIEAVDVIIGHIDSGKLSGADAVEAVHLTAEPQNVNPEYQGALDEVIHMFEKDAISADEAIDGIKETHAGFVDLYITSDLIEAVDVIIGHIDSGKLSGADAVEAVHLTAEPQNVNPEYQGALDEVIHMFEKDAISADEAIDGIKETHAGFVDLYITSDLIEAVDVIIGHIDSGKLSGADAVEAVHLTAEPQNVNPEYQGALDEVIHMFEKDAISADEAIDGIKETHAGFVDLYITSDLIEAVDVIIGHIDSGKLSGADAVEAVHLTAEPQNVNPEYQGALDEVIHMFEKDAISADEAIDGIKETHAGFVDLYITSDLIEAVDVIIGHIDSGKLSGADAVEAVHLTAEPQNVNPEYMGALDEVLHEYELDGTSADDALAEIIEIHEGFTGLYITSEVIEDAGIQLNIYDTGNVSVEHVIHEIHEVIEDAELAAAAAMSDTGIPVMKELPPNHVDIPVGSGVPGCEVDDWCYMPADLHVHVGDTVTWVNSDSLPHTVTSVSSTGAEKPTPEDEDGLFDSGFMSGGDEWSYTFDVEGEYYYYCQLHPWMEGEVTVQ